MRVQRQKADVDAERRLVTGMIVDTRFLSGIAPIIREELLRTPYAKTVANWCLDYHAKYGEAPGRTIQDLFESHARGGRLDEDQADLIGRMLQDLSRRWEGEQDEAFNAPYELDKAERYIRERSLDAVMSDIKAFLSQGDLEQAEAAVGGFRRAARPESRGLNPLDPAVAMAAFTGKDEEALFQLPGDLGRMLGPFCREQLWAVLAPQKRGKSWWLVECAMRAVLAGLSVLFVSLELSELAVIRRFYSNICGLPSERHAGATQIPVWDCLTNQMGDCDRGCGVRLLGKDDERPKISPKGYGPCSACRGTDEWQAATWFRTEDLPPLTGSRAVKKAKALLGQYVRGGRLRVMRLPSGRVTMQEFLAILDNLEYYDKLVPDVIVTDFADKFARDTKMEYRHGIADIWEQHKAISQERRCLVLTASQANTIRSGKDAGQGSWAEDIRKFGELDGAWALNQTPTERAEGIMRVPVIGIREDDFDMLGQAIVLEQKRIGRPYLDSHWGGLAK